MSIFGSKAEDNGAYTRISPDQMMTILGDMGFRPELAQTSQGKPMIRFQIEGVRASIFFYGADDGKAKSLQFYAGFREKPALEKVNAFNCKRRFAKAYLDKDGEVCLDMDLDVEGGVLRAGIEEVVRDWCGCLAGFLQEMRAAA